MSLIEIKNGHYLKNAPVFNSVFSVTEIKPSSNIIPEFCTKSTYYSILN